jgi:cytochrome P450
VQRAGPDSPGSGRRSGRRRSADLVAGRADDDRLDNDEIVALCALLLVAGFETTANLIANSVHQLAQNPEQLLAIAHGAASIDLAVEELLRTAGPVQFTQRVLLEDIDIDGHRIPAGSLVALLIGAANRDPNVFDCPDRIDLSQDPNPHLSFSFGIYHCLGAALARLEAAIGIPAIIQELPNLALAEKSAWRDTFVLRGMTSLPVRWDFGAKSTSH